MLGKLMVLYLMHTYVNEVIYNQAYSMRPSVLYLGILVCTTSYNYNLLRAIKHTEIYLVHYL